MSEYNFVKCAPEEFTIKKGVFRYTGQKSAIIIPDEVTEFKSTTGKNLKAVYIGKNISKVSTNKVEWFEVDKENPYFASLDGVLFNKDYSELHKYPILNKRTEYVIPSTTIVIKKEAFIYATIKNLTLHDGIRTIEEGAFTSIKKLDKIEWPQAATTIESCVFHKSSITAIELPETLERIESSVFSCSKLKSITLPNSVTYLGHGAFDFCQSLEKVVLSDSLTEIPDRCFYYCKNLNFIKVPNSVKTIGKSAFYDCVSLHDLSFLPDSIETIGERAFYGNDSLETIVLPSSLKTLGDHSFGACKNVTSITLPEGVETIGPDAFCLTHVKSIVIPDSVKDVGTIFDDFENVTKHTLTEEEEIKKKEATQKHAEEKAQREKWKKSSEETQELLAEIKDEGIYVFQTSAFRLVKAREENASKLNALYVNRNYEQYNSLLLSVNEIPNVPVFTYSCCNQTIKAYKRNGIDGTFAIEVSGIVYLLNVFSDSIRDNSTMDYCTDASELDKAIITGIAGGAFLGYLATQAAQVYTDIDVNVTFYNKETNKDIVTLIFADNYRARTSEASWIANQISEFTNAVFDNCMQNTSNDEIATHAYIKSSIDKIHQSIASQNARLAEKAKKDSEERFHALQATRVAADAERKQLEKESNLCALQTTHAATKTESKQREDEDKFRALQAARKQREQETNFRALQTTHAATKTESKQREDEDKFRALQAVRAAAEAERKRKEVEEMESRRKAEELTANRNRYDQLMRQIAEQNQIISENKGWFGAQAKIRKTAQKQILMLQDQLLNEFPYGRP